jgi:hypothetical protein
VPHDLDEQADRPYLFGMATALPSYILNEPVGNAWISRYCSYLAIDLGLPIIIIDQSGVRADRKLYYAIELLSPTGMGDFREIIKDARLS